MAIQTTIRKYGKDFEKCYVRITSIAEMSLVGVLIRARAWTNQEAATKIIVDGKWDGFSTQEDPFDDSLSLAISGEAYKTLMDSSVTGTFKEVVMTTAYIALMQSDLWEHEVEAV